MLTRSLPVLAAFICLSLLQTPAAVPAQTPKKVAKAKKDAAPTARERSAAIARLLEMPMVTEKLQDIPLKDFLEVTTDELKRRASNLKIAGGKEPLFEDGNIPIIVNKGAFLAELGPDGIDPYTEKVSLPTSPKSMSMQLALRLVLAQVSNDKATFLVCRGHLEIVPRKYAAAALLLNQSSVFLSFKQQPLPEVLQDLSDETGLPINLDPNVGKKGQTLISATFRNSSLEDALVTVTEMAELKFVVLERSVFVTTPERVEVLRKEEKERAATRKLFEQKIKRLEPAM